MTEGLSLTLISKHFVFLLVLVSLALRAFTHIKNSKCAKLCDLFESVSEHYLLIQPTFPLPSVRRKRASSE